METSDSDSRSKIETRQFTFAELPDYSEISHFKPEGFKTPEKSFEISSWREAYRIFCQYLLKEKPRHIRALKNLEETFLGRRVMFSKSPLRLTDAYRLSDGFYVELRIPPKSIIHNISRLIQFCRLSLRQFAVSIPVYIEESETSEPEAVEDGQNEVNYQLAESGQPTEEMSQESVSEQTAEPDSSVYKPFRFTLENRIPDLDSATPISLTIGKSSFPISKWRDVLVETARYIVKNEAESFRRYLYKNFGPKWNNSPLFSDKRSDLALAHEIDSNLFVETNFNAAECVKKALLFIRYTNIKPSTVKIEYKPKEAVSETAPTQNASAAQPTEQGTEERRSSEQIIKTGGFIFTQSVYLSMFFTGIEIPAQCHKEFLNNLTVELKEGMSTPVTIWFNDVKYSAAINYLTSANPDTTPQIRFTWNSNLPIAIALRKACPESFQVLELNSHIGNNEAKKDVSDTITISCASNRNEFILLINSQKTNSVLQEETAQSDEKPREFQEIYYKYHSDTISELVKDDSDSTPEESVGQNKAEKQGVDSQSDDQQSVEDEESELQEPASHVVIPSGSDSARFSLDEPIPDLTYTKPTSIKIDRHLYTISKWREVLTLTVEYLAEYEPLSFKFLKEKFGKKNNHSRQLFSSVPSSLLKPYKINPNVWVEINFSAVDCVKKAIEFLEFCYVKLSTVEIKYKPKETASESTSTPDASAAASDVVQPAEPKVETPATFTKPLDLSMFFTYIVIPTQCHKAFLENLTVELKEGMSEPVTLWFNDVKYKVLINNLYVPSADSASQIRFTWNPNLPIAIALRKACPESFQILERNSYSKTDEDKQEISDVVTISCGIKPNEFVLQVNPQKTSDYPEAKQEQTVHQPDALE
ncbi:MAG: hypothetical protein IKS45_03165, partial [Thermoguttaceae bacterium]|nr:hypothetical protein [Thermoguttaceae bacterium]